MANSVLASKVVSTTTPVIASSAARPGTRSSRQLVPRFENSEIWAAGSTHNQGGRQYLAPRGKAGILDAVEQNPRAGDTDIGGGDTDGGQWRKPGRCLADVIEPGQCHVAAGLPAGAQQTKGRAEGDGIVGSKQVPSAARVSAWRRNRKPRRCRCGRADAAGSTRSRSSRGRNLPSGRTRRSSLPHRQGMRYAGGRGATDARWRVRVPAALSGPAKAPRRKPRTTVTHGRPHWSSSSSRLAGVPVAGIRIIPSTDCSRKRFSMRRWRAGDSSVLASSAT